MVVGASAAGAPGGGHVSPAVRVRRRGPRRVLRGRAAGGAAHPAEPRGGDGAPPRKPHRQPRVLHGVLHAPPLPRRLHQQTAEPGTRPLPGSGKTLSK